MADQPIPVREDVTPPADERIGEPEQLETPARSWRTDVTLAGASNLLLGIWLMASPFLLDYTDGDSPLNPFLCGGLVAIAALTRITMAPSSIAIGLVNMAVGAWLVGSGFWLAESAPAVGNAWIMGAAVFVLALIEIASSRQRDAVSRPTTY